MSSAKFEDCLYLGTWFQRTSLHLKELYNFLRFKQAVPGLSAKKITELWNKLNPVEVAFTDEHNYELVKFKSQGVIISVTEDGVVRLKMPIEGGLDEARKKVEDFYKEVFGPILAYLFSRGAPLPRPLAELKTVYPLILVTNDAARYEDLFAASNDEAYFNVVSPNFEIRFGHQLHLFIVKTRSESYTLGELIENVIFYREFEEQLDHYLNLHRALWEDVSRIRESKSLRYRDFPLVRQRLLEFQKTLSFVKARLAQMNDIISARSTLMLPAIKIELEQLGFYRFLHLQANQLYLSHLWEMTIEYAQETLVMLDSLFQENTQRELGALKFITFIAALTGFFGMNIAFPWEERWSAHAASSAWVLALIGLTSIMFYGLLRIFIYNRRFVLRQKRQ